MNIDKEIQKGLEIAEGVEFGNTHAKEHAITYFKALILKTCEEVYEDWEVGIRFASNDEQNSTLDGKVMREHLRMSKEQRQTLKELI